MKRTRGSQSLGMALVIGMTVAISTGGSALGQERFTLDMMRRIVGVSSPAPSPDGKSAAIVVTRPNYVDNRNESELFSVDIATGAARQLTYARHDVSQPQWSPDGSRLGFIASDKDGNPQIWIMPIAGGDAWQLTSSHTGVEHYAWRPDGAAIAFAAADEPPKLEGEARYINAFRVGDQDIFLRTPLQPLHVWLIPAVGGEATRLTSGSWSLEFTLPPSSPPSGLSWSPDGREIAFARVPAPESGKVDQVNVWILDIASRQTRPMNGAKRFQNTPKFSPDGKTVSYWYPREGRAESAFSEVCLAPAAGGEGRSLTRALGRNLYYSEWMPGGREMVVAGNDQTSVGIWLQPLGGPARRLDLGDLVVSGAYGYEVAVAITGAIMFVGSTASSPAELYVMDTPSALPRRLTNFNAWAADVKWARMERIAWKGPDGFDEDGVLVFPADFSPSVTYPLVLVIHGGPNTASKTSFYPLAQLMAAEGWLVFMPNYRGSDNLGESFYAAIVGDAGRGPGRDVMSGLAEILKRPYVDKKRKAVTGWSYGGYMTTWLLGNYPDEWRAGMAGAPVTNWEDVYNYSDGNVINASYLGLGGSPWIGDVAKKYREQSPITYATRIRAPTLIMSNMEDFRVPPTQAFALYHALKDNGVKTEFIGFAGRTHASADPVNARERTRLWIDWVKQHIGK